MQLRFYQSRFYPWTQCMVSSAMQRVCMGAWHAQTLRAVCTCAQMASMQEMLEWLGRTARAGGCSVPFCTGPFDTAPPAWQVG